MNSKNNPPVTNEQLARAMGTYITVGLLTIVLFTQAVNVFSNEPDTEANPTYNEFNIFENQFTIPKFGK